MRALPIQPVYGGPRYVVGLCIIRGSPLPVVDVGLLIGERATAAQRLVTVRTGSRIVALAADAVPGIWAFDGLRLDALPPLLRDAATDAIAAVGTLDAELLFLLRTASIVPEGFLEHLDAHGAVS